ncbi:MAG: 50S ribosomal protein L7/L12 [Candidatus Dojkabacteria bacterium]|nr:50S ribosomal protein L7/L12 [Candidatus Dojkabacteria bacterium]
MTEKIEKILEMLSQLTIVEAFELKKALEERFGIQGYAAMMPQAMIGTTDTKTTAASDATGQEEKTDFDVLLVDAGSNKIGIIKIVKAATGLGLKEAKDLVDSVAPGQPKPIREGIKKEEAQKLKEELEKEGAKVELK